MFSSPHSTIKQFGVSSGMAVADFGVGAGSYIRELAKAVEDHGIVYALDVQKDLLSKLAKELEREKIGNVRTMWVDLEEERGSKLADNVLDAVFAINILFQLEKKNVFMSEVARVLRPGGRALIIDWTGSFGHMGPHPDKVVLQSRAQSLAEHEGLVVQGTIPAGDHHYGLILRKPV